MKEEHLKAELLFCEVLFASQEMKAQSMHSHQTAL